jgi:hypothetical protein
MADFEPLSEDANSFQDFMAETWESRICGRLVREKVQGG